MTHKSKKLLCKQLKSIARNRNKVTSHTNPNSEDGPHWNPVDYPADSLESNEDCEEVDDSFVDEVFEDREYDEVEYD